MSTLDETIVFLLCNGPVVCGFVALSHVFMFSLFNLSHFSN